MTTNHEPKTIDLTPSLEGYKQIRERLAQSLTSQRRDHRKIERLLNYDHPRRDDLLKLDEESLGFIDEALVMLMVSKEKAIAELEESIGQIDRYLEAMEAK